MTRFSLKVQGFLKFQTKCKKIPYKKSLKKQEFLM